MNQLIIEQIIVGVICLISVFVLVVDLRHFRSSKYFLRTALIFIVAMTVIFELMWTCRLLGVRV